VIIIIIIISVVVMVVILVMVLFPQEPALYLQNCITLGLTVFFEQRESERHVRM
jgi:hypothetical protein